MTLRVRSLKYLLYTEIFKIHWKLSFLLVAFVSIPSSPPGLFMNISAQDPCPLIPVRSHVLRQSCCAFVQSDAELVLCKKMRLMWLSSFYFACYRQWLQVSCRRKIIRRWENLNGITDSSFVIFRFFFTKCQIQLSNVCLVWIEVHGNMIKTRIILVEAVAPYEVFWVED